MNPPWCFLFLVLFRLVKCDTTNITLDRYGIPRMFEMENYWGCYDHYCRIDIRVKPQDIQSKIYTEIKISQNDPKHRYNREYYHRMRCISQNIPEEKFWNHTKKMVQTEFDPWNSTVEIVDIRCLKPFSVAAITEIDVLLYVMSIAAVTVVFQSTLYDVLDRLGELSSVKSLAAVMSKEFEYLFFSLSIFKNWERVRQKRESADYQRLKSIQGIRFFNTILMIAWHTKNSYVFVYLDDAPKWEEILSHPLMFLTMQAELLLVQIYFMISSFLLTNQILEIYSRNKEFTIYDVGVMFLNRIARLFLPLAVMTIMSVSYAKILAMPHIFDSVQMGQDECIKSWWGTMFQLNFLFPFAKMCIPTTWYISLDTLFYLSTLVLMYVKLKLNLDLKKLLAILFLTFSAIYGNRIFKGGLDIMYKAYPQNFKDLLHAPDFDNLYINPFANWSTSFIGIAFGSIYFHTKNKSDKDLGLSSITKSLFYLIFLTLPAVVVFLTTVDWAPGLQRSLVGPVIRPLYAAVFGVGLLGMSRGYGGIIKKVLEFKYLIFYGDFTYCTYVFHFFIVFSKGVLNNDLVPITWSNLLFWIIVDVIASFGLGILTTVLAEQPGIAFQKMYLPQIVKKPLADGKKSMKIK